VVFTADVIQTFACLDLVVRATSCVVAPTLAGLAALAIIIVVAFRAALVVLLALGVTNLLVHEVLELDTSARPFWQTDGLTCRCMSQPTILLKFTDFEETTWDSVIIRCKLEREVTKAVGEDVV
jgi:hypothetical protein